jgi:hypothetical protein
VAEVELGVLARQCLDRRIAGLEALRREVAAWVATRNAPEVKVRANAPLKGFSGNGLHCCPRAVFRPLNFANYSAARS